MDSPLTLHTVVMACVLQHIFREAKTLLWAGRRVQPSYGMEQHRFCVISIAT